MATTTIHYNGPHRAPDSIGALKHRLRYHTLDPRCALHGGVIRSEDTRLPHGSVRFVGGFEDISGAFCVDTDDLDLVAELTALVQANEASETYAIAQRALDNERRRAAARTREFHDRRGG